MPTVINYFIELEGPRVDRTKDHLLEDIIFITIAAVICGSETWNEIEDYGKSKENWLKTLLKLPNGIPSHDTFNRFFSALDSDKFEAVFLSWVKDLAKITNGDIVSIDGKTLRGSRDKGSKRAIHMVSAWSKLNQISLGQLKVDDKSNEITAIPRLLDVLELKDCLVTIDAMGCQREIAEKIVEKGADYILAVKGNQGTLLSNIEDTVRFATPTSEDIDEDFGHGRIETRKCTLYSDLSNIEKVEHWKKLTSIVKVESSRYHKSDGKEEKETRFYITSSAETAQIISNAVRSHWGIENKLHWQLDVSFNEDKSRKRAGNAAQNFSMINRIALNMVKNESSKKRSVRGKRLDAGWNNEYLLKILKI